MTLRPVAASGATAVGLAALLFVGECNRPGVPTATIAPALHVATDADTQDPARAGSTKPDRPVDVFADLDGTWTGSFVGWSTDGREEYRISVRQDYETVDANTQKVRVRDTLPDGDVVTGEGENIARRLADGSLELRCVVRKSTGETVEHQGRLGRGPRGEKVLFWYSLGDDKRETFREWVEGEGDDAVYRIQGVGTYGESTYVMAGDYTRPE